MPYAFLQLQCLGRLLAASFLSLVTHVSSCLQLPAMSTFSPFQTSLRFVLSTAALYVDVSRSFNFLRRKLTEVDSSGQKGWVFISDQVKIHAKSILVQMNRCLYFTVQLLHDTVSIEESGHDSHTL